MSELLKGNFEVENKVKDKNKIDVLIKIRKTRFVNYGIRS